MSFFYHNSVSEGFLNIFFGTNCFKEWHQ